MAWLGASAYAKIQLTDPEAVEVKLTKMNTNGSTGYYSIGFARKDSGITSIEDAKGKVFAFAEPNSTSGYLVPGAELTAKYGDLKSYFGEVKMSAGMSRPSSASPTATSRRASRGRRLRQLGRRLRLGRFPQGRRRGPRRHERPRRNLALHPDPGRPDGRPQGASGRRQGQGHQLTADLWETDANALTASRPVRRRTSSRSKPKSTTASSPPARCRKAPDPIPGRTLARGPAFSFSGHLNGRRRLRTRTGPPPQPCRPARGLYLDMVRRMRMYGGILLVVFVALMASAGTWPKTATPAVSSAACTRSSLSRPRSSPKPGKSAPFCPASSWPYPALIET